MENFGGDTGIDADYEKGEEMKKFNVSATHLEYLLTKEIEAKDEDEARGKYLELWEEGMIEVNDSKVENFFIEEIT